MATYKYLDTTGLGQLWNKVKGKDTEVLREIGQRLGESTNNTWWQTLENVDYFQDFMNYDNPSIIAYHNQGTVIFLYRHDYDDVNFSFNYYSLDGKALLTYDGLGSVWQLIVDNTVIEEIGSSTISDFSFYVPKGEWISEGLSRYLIADAEWHDVTTFLSEIESVDIFDILDNYNVIAFTRNIESDGNYSSFTLFNVDREYYSFSSFDNIVRMAYDSFSNRWEYYNRMSIEYINDWSGFGVYIKPSPHPNWEESDSTSLDYIKNKPPIHAATGTNSTIIGDTNNQATGSVSIVSGYGNSSSGNYSIANGYNNTITAQYGATTGSGNAVSGQYGIAIGSSNKAKNNWSVTHGNYSEASANFAVASGSRTKASGAYSFAFGTNSQRAILNLTGDASATTYSTTVNDQSTADTLKQLAPSLYVASSSGSPIRVTSIVDGNQSLELLITFESTLSTTSISQASYVFNQATATTGDVSVAMGLANLASNQASTAFGSNNVSSGVASFVEGKSNVASSLQSHAEGYLTVSSSNQSHAEGRSTTASDMAAHSEGYGTTASGEASHSENKSTVASGKYTHAQGEYTQANGYAETAIGRYNTLSNANAQTTYNTTNSPYILVAGNGTADNARSNAHTLDWSGNGWYAGKLTVGTAPTNNMDVATKKYVDDNVKGYAISLSSNVITLTGSDGSTSSVTLPVYNGSVSGGGSS